MWKRRRRDRIQSQADQLTLECELLLAGRYATIARARGRPVPPWAWAAVLAHATDEDLRTWAGAEVTGQDDEPAGTAEWLEAVTFLAKDIGRHLRSTGVSLDDLQRTTLVPLELELMRDRRSAVPPRQLVGVVLAAVHHHPSRPPR